MSDKLVVLCSPSRFPRATRDVTVSMSAFLAYHQCYCADSSLTWGLNLRAFSEARSQGFSLGTPVSSPPSSV